MVVPVGHDGHARHHRPGRRPLLVDPRARRQDGRDPGLHQQTWFKVTKPGHLPRPVRRALRPQPREHDRHGARRAARRVPALVRPSRRPRSRPRRTAAASSAGSSGAAGRAGRRGRRRRRRAPAPRAAETPDRDPFMATIARHSPAAGPARRPAAGARRSSPHRVKDPSRGLDLVGHDDRPQEDRDPLPRDDVRLLRPGRGRGAADPPPARRAGQHASSTRRSTTSCSRCTGRR